MLYRMYAEPLLTAGTAREGQRAGACVSTDPRVFILGGGAVGKGLGVVTRLPGWRCFSIPLRKS